MKKLILASAIAALTANAASAATIYEKDGLKFQIKGDWQIQFRDRGTSGRDTDVEFDDLELKNKVTYDLGNGVTAFGELHYDVRNDSADGDELEEAFLGVEYHNVSVLVGQTDNAVDEFAIESAYEDISESIFNGVGSSDGEDVIRIDADFGAVTLVASHELGDNAPGNDRSEENTEVFIAGDLGPVTLSAAYQVAKDDNTDDTQDLWGVGAAFDAGFAEFAVAYGESDSDDVDEQAEQISFVSKFKVSKTTKVVLGYEELDRDVAGQVDVEQIYANITYKFPKQKNVSLFAEISEIEEGVDGNDDRTDILAGMRIKF